MNNTNNTNDKAVLELINNISIKDLFDRMGYKYTSAWSNEYRIKWTDGWSFNTAKNIAVDFSWNNRWQGCIFNIIKEHFKLDNKGTYQWFKNEYGNLFINIRDDENTNSNNNDSNIKNNNVNNNSNVINTVEHKNKEEITEEQRIKIKDIWNSLKETTPEQKKYMYSRWIDTMNQNIKEITRNHNGGIWLAVYDNKGMIGIVNRNIQPDSKIRFGAEKGFSTDGIYMGKIDKDIKKIYVVEGLMDFLTLYQYTNNVVWLKTWKNGIEIVKEMANKWYEIIYIYDNDEQGNKSLQEMQEKINWIYYFDIKNYNISNNLDENIKDINQFYNECMFLSNSSDNDEDERNKTNILKLIDTYKQQYKKVNNTTSNAIDKLKGYTDAYKMYWKLWIDTPFKQIDKDTEGMIRWKVYTIGASSNTGKTKFSYNYISHFLKMNMKVSLFSLEVDTWFCIMGIGSLMENIKYNDIKMGKVWLNSDLYNNLYLYDDKYKMDEIEQQILKDKPDVVVIDFLQNIQTDGDGEYQKMANIARKIQQIAIQNNIIIIALSQLSNEMGKGVSKGEMDFITLKGAGELVASSDCIFLLFKKEDNICLKVVKNKYWIAGNIYTFDVDWSYWWKFSLFLDEMEERLK